VFLFAQQDFAMPSQFSDDPWQTFSAPPAAVLGPGRVLGSYQLLAPLGNGGMGMVFRARHVVLKKEFALKVLSPRLACDADAIRRFQRETEALGRLEHPHLVRASDAGVIDGMPFLVMELLNGADLAQLTVERGPWPIAEACAAVLQAALGLQHAFERGLVHRDIKPSNLWLTPAGQVKVLDLGLARLCDEGAVPMTEAGAWMGTPDYIAPEQILDSHTADTRADLYSLGCTLFHLLAGDPPFGASTHPTLRQKSEAHLREPPPDIRIRRADVPAGLAAVLARLLAKRPEDRYATPAEAAAALTPFAADARLETLSGKHAPSTPAASTRSEGPLPTTLERTTTASTQAKRLGLWIAAAVVLLASGVGLAAYLSRHAEPDSSSPTLPNGGTIIPEKVQVLSLDVKLYPTVNGHRAPPRLLGKDAFLTHCDDSVTVDARLSRPAYAFLIAFRPDGTDEVCFPEKEDEAPPRTAQPKYPSVSQGVNYGLDEGAGLQAFALVVSSEPLPSYKEWWSQRRGCPWQKHAAPRGVVWRTGGLDDVEALTEDDPDGRRGKGVAVQGKTPVAQLAAWLRRTPQVEALQVRGFAVMPKAER